MHGELALSAPFGNLFKAQGVIPFVALSPQYGDKVHGIIDPSSPVHFVSRERPKWPSLYIIHWQELLGCNLGLAASMLSHL